MLADLCSEGLFLTRTSVNYRWDLFIRSSRIIDYSFISRGIQCARRGEDAFCGTACQHPNMKLAASGS